jgi:predicted nucleotidyltransferase
VDKQIEQKREELINLCRLHRVQRLAVFGSALREDFDSQHSDFDFLVEFQPLPTGAYADAYFGLMEGLEKALPAACGPGRRVGHQKPLLPEERSAKQTLALCGLRSTNIFTIFNMPPAW